jgi:hypothetical protein
VSDERPYCNGDFTDDPEVMRDILKVIRSINSKDFFIGFHGNQALWGASPKAFASVHRQDRPQRQSSLKGQAMIYESRR